MPTFEFIRNKEKIYSFAGADRERLVYWLSRLKTKDVNSFTPAEIKSLIEDQPQVSFSWYWEVATNLVGPVIILVLIGFYVFMCA